MSHGLSDLDERIAALTDEELQQMVGEDAADYRPEALEIAREELARRGLEAEDSRAEEAAVAWTCPKCGTLVEPDYQTCWKCGTSQEGVLDPRFRPADEPATEDGPAGDVEGMDGPDYGLTFRVFRGGALTTWKTLLAEAAAFASRIPPERLVSISQSGDAESGIVTVWYREGPQTSGDEENEDVDAPEARSAQGRGKDTGPASEDEA